MKVRDKIFYFFNIDYQEVAKFLKGWIFEDLLALTL